MVLCIILENLEEMVDRREDWFLFVFSSLVREGGEEEGLFRYRLGRFCWMDSLSKNFFIFRF